MSSRFGKVLQNFSKLPAVESSLADHPAVLPKPEMEARRTGRPAGKKSNPDYTQVTVYIRKGTHLAAKKVLLDDGREFSELVEELLIEWLKTSRSPKV